MNTLILEHDQLCDHSCAQLSARQIKHIKDVLKLSESDTLTVGLINGALGKATLTARDDVLTLSNVTLDQAPPPALAFKLILALPRPQMLKRILQTVSIFGVEELILIQSNRVEKSFWQSPSATDEAIREQLVLGLEQGKATQLPKIRKFSRFKSFMEDDCPKIIDGHRALLAHPGDFDMCPSNMSQEKVALAIGPEGGFTEYEVDLFLKTGFTPIQMGQRILKVETAVTALLGRLI